MRPNAVIVVFVALAVFGTVAQEPEVTFKTFIERLVKLALPIRPPTGQQFGGLFFYKLLGNTLPPYSFNPVPSDPNGNLPIHTNERFAPNLNQLNNYLVAAPQTKGSKNSRHVENFVLRQHGDDLINSYTAKHGNTPPEYALLYTFWSPCDNCREIIVAFANNHKQLNLTLAYTAPYPNTNVAFNLNEIRNAGVAVVQVGACQGATMGKRSASIAACQLKTFQGCLLQLLGDLCCLRNMSDKVAFINDVAVDCYPGYNQTCSDSFIADRLRSCPTETSKLQSDFYKLVASCSLHAVSNPLQTSKLNQYTGKLFCPNCLQPAPRSCGVKQLTACGRRDGVCTTTAGNSICRDDHYCDFHGDAGYSWCYVDDDDNWDYCCLESCRMDRDQDALICYAGQESNDTNETDSAAVYRYCGDAGTRTVKGEACRPDHPCGTHNGTHYYWCFTEANSNATTWDYCCRPDQVCSKDGENVDWCYVGQERTKIACNATRAADCEGGASYPSYGGGACQGDATGAATRMEVHQAMMQALLVGLWAAVAVPVSALPCLSLKM